MSLSNNEPKGIGGWLIVFMIVVAHSALLHLFPLLTYYLPIILDGNWGLVTSPASPEYHPLIGPLMIFNISFRSLYIAYSLVLLVLIVKKHHLVPRLVIWYFAGAIVFFFLVICFKAIISSSNNVFSFSTFKDLILSLIRAAIWVNYFLCSKRVKNTFVEKEL